MKAYLHFSLGAEGEFQALSGADGFISKHCSSVAQLRIKQQ
jgi:hypothetical protein